MNKYSSRERRQIGINKEAERKKRNRGYVVSAYESECWWWW
jgi:hypothetical protein